MSSTDHIILQACFTLLFWTTYWYLCHKLNTSFLQACFTLFFGQYISFLTWLINHISFLAYLTSVFGSRATSWNDVHLWYPLLHNVINCSHHEHNAINWSYHESHMIPPYYIYITCLLPKRDYIWLHSTHYIYVFSESFFPLFLYPFLVATFYKIRYTSYGSRGLVTNPCRPILACTENITVIHFEIPWNFWCVRPCSPWWTDTHFRLHS